MNDSSPAALKHPLVPSHGSNLLGVFYLAAGAQPHPTAIIFNGFPGFEQNLDLAQAMRRVGWNVLALHYRGSWGVKGTFSLIHCVEDADAEVDYVMDPKNAGTFHIDRSRIVVVGHSMGGTMAVSAAAHHPAVAATILLSAWNAGAIRSGEAEEARALAGGENLAPIHGAGGASLARETFQYRSKLDMVALSSRVATRPVLIVTANDNSDQFAEPFAAALRSAGDRQIHTEHFDTDHAYSDKRVELTSAVLDFIRGL